ncbi:hypothetical protein NE237_004297 [Protea cynaroides]|uniref:Nodulin-like domain-containing protein n=1 Tax=Protea cynaroides TaxID=273540 RepID=A0A9Q0KIE6_9MAGN|nr:hypothetical protein NE237_004297 [Protea cynaroides]
MPTPTTIQWLSMVGIVWLQAISGTNTDFPAYSSQLKQLLSISQVQLNNLAFASDAGKLFGWFSGIAAIYLPLWLVLLIGSTLGLIGYGLQFLFVINKISSLSYLQFFFLTILAGNSICWINTVCYVLINRNISSQKQVALGVSTSYGNLTAKIYTILVEWIFPSSSKKAQRYLLLNSVVPLGVSMLTTSLVREVEVEKEKHINGGFIVMFFITVATGIYSVLGSIGAVSIGSPLIHVVVMGVLLAAPLVIPLVICVRVILEEKYWWSSNSTRERRIHDLSVNIEVVVGEDKMENETKEVQGIEHELEEEEVDDGIIRAKEEIGVKLMVQRVDFWLYFFVYLFGATLGLVYLNNLGQVAESYKHSNTTSLVSLSSSFGFFGRLVPSLWDYFFSKTRYRISGVASVVTLMVPMTGAFFLLVEYSSLSLYISTAIIGVCSGAISSVAVSVTAELFGTKNFSVNHNVVIANIPIGSFSFGYMAAILYQRAGDEEQYRCIGVECYRKTFIIWGSICSFGTLLAFILYLRTRKFYLQR